MNETPEQHTGQPSDRAPEDYEMLDPSAPWVGPRNDEFYPSKKTRQAIRIAVHQTLHSNEGIGQTATTVTWLTGCRMYTEALAEQEGPDVTEKIDSPTTSTIKLELSRMLGTQVRMAPNRGLYSRNEDPTLKAMVTGLSEVIGKRHL